ncbi:MAG: ribonuclease E/G [Lachnospiraceae bacterium]|nr:ribonuclease E/G [Lachnospiraceae bacterium]
MKYIINRETDPAGGSVLCSYLLDERGKAIEIRKTAEGWQDQNRFRTGSIFIGMVTKVAANLDAVFVDIAPGRNCYLPAHAIKHPLYAKKGPSALIAQGDQVVVQLAKEGTHLKSPALTTEFTLPGYAAVLVRSGRNGISRRISDPEKKEALKKMAAEHAPAGYALVMRTRSADLPKEDILSEMDKLREKAASIEKRAVHALCYTCLYEAAAPYLQSLLSLPAGTEILTEEQALYEAVCVFLQEHCPVLLPGVHLYQDRLLPMAKSFCLEREMWEATDDRVWLKSGAFLIVSYTEALTVFDVNSGKAVPSKKKSREEVVLSVNLEAAAECMRQLRLRNLSGIILIDFINMETEGAKEQLMDTLQCLAVHDPAGVKVVDMTPLGIVEMTRKREGERLQ